MVSIKKSSNVIILDRGEDTTICVNLHGASITSWRYNNKEQLFCSLNSTYDQKFPITGGISINFPESGEWRFGPPNGFARIAPWKVERLEETPHFSTESQDVRVVLSLADDQFSKAFWNYQFQYTYTITLKEKQIHLQTQIKNTSTMKTMRFKIEFPVFLRVPDLSRAHIQGLTNCEFTDRNNVDEGIQCDNEASILVKKKTYRAYKNEPNEILIHNMVDGHKMKIYKKSLGDLIIWHPWNSQNDEGLNLRPEECKEMIQVRPGTVSEEVQVRPGMTFECKVILEICKEPLFEILPW